LRKELHLDDPAIGKGMNLATRIRRSAWQDQHMGFRASEFE